jgi:hypothetical protein
MRIALFTALLSAVYCVPLYEESTDLSDYAATPQYEGYGQEYYDPEEYYETSPEEYYEDDADAYYQDDAEYYDYRIPQNQPFIRRAFRAVKRGVSRVANNPIARQAWSLARQTPIGAKVNMGVNIARGIRQGGVRGGFNAARSSVMNHPYANLARSGIQVGRQLRRGNVRGALSTAASTGVNFVPGPKGRALRRGLSLINGAPRYQEEQENENYE